MNNYGLFLSNLSIDMLIEKIEMNMISKNLDLILGGGFYKGYLYVCGGRPGMGKTTVALDIVTGAINAGKKVIYYNIDNVPTEKLIEKIIYRSAKVGFPEDNGFLGRDEIDRIRKSAEDFKNSNIGIRDDDEVSVDDIVNELKYRPDCVGAEIVIIDYLQLIDNYYNNPVEVLRKIKKYAKENGVTFILLSQLDKSCEKRPDHRPYISDIKGSSYIEEIANVIILLYRDEYYDRDTCNLNIWELDVMKNNLGRTGKVLIKKKSDGTFEDVGLFLT